tara:strand:- start:318 stop:653 length:336 start_codon:yes stop_codon:yes gene_type:complete
MGVPFQLKSRVQLDKEQVNAQRKAHARWQEYSSGNAYILYIENRTMNHHFRVQSYGKSIFQSVKRYYRGLDNACNWIWQCTKVVSVYECIDKKSSEAGKFLAGKEQASHPW